MKTWLISFILIIQVANTAAQAIKYVNQAGAGLKDGSNWNNAFPADSLRYKLQQAIYGDTFYVANGIYKPSLTNRYFSFYIPNGVRVFGGFSVNDTLFGQRNWFANPTILSGEINAFGTYDNSFHVVSFDNADSTTTLDGFIVKDGNANYSGTLENGGGVYIHCTSPSVKCKANIANCRMENNLSYARGGAVYIIAKDGGEARLSFYNCMFNYNHSDTGGAVYNEASSAGLIINNYSNCTFNGNTAYKGGAVYNNSSSCDTCIPGHCFSTFINCSFTNNFANYVGGAICDKSRYSGLTSDTLYNCIIWNNSLPAIYNHHKKRVVLRYCDYQGDWQGKGNHNINEDPMFENSGNHPLRLKPCSPCIDKGTSNNCTLADITGTPRPQLSAIDMGAYESLSQIVGSNKIYVNKSATGLNNGSSWIDAFTNLQSALSACNVDTIWVAQGTYFPTDTTDRKATFNIRNGLKLFGGFAGNEDSLVQRDFENHVCILSGAIGSAAETDNSIHVVTFHYVSPKTLLDGFTISDGYVVSADFSNGAGIYNLGAYSSEGSSPEIANCIFRNNKCQMANGAAIFNNCSNGGKCISVIRKCIFTKNAALEGSVIYNLAIKNGVIKIKFKNCLFTENQGTTSLILTLSNPLDSFAYLGSTYVNCTFADNVTTLGNILNTSNYPLTHGIDTLINCIIWNNEINSFLASSSKIAMINCDVDFGWAGNGSNNLSADPLFLRTGNHPYALSECSPCINTGTNYLAPPTDLAGNPRPQLSGFDIGAYESVSNNSAKHKVFVRAQATGANTGLNWTDAFTDLQSALTGCVDTIWIAAGTYKPTSGTDRHLSFIIPSGQKIFGGFIGTEDSLSQRNWFVNPAILSGSIAGTVDYDNSIHVVKINYADSSTLLDGLTIRDGNNYGMLIGNDCNGSGIYNSAQFSSKGSHPRIFNCSFINNKAVNLSGYAVTDRYKGAGFYTNSQFGASHTQFENCRFSKNVAYSGGACYFNNFLGNVNSTFINCLFDNNFAITGGGAIEKGCDSLSLIEIHRFKYFNCTFVNDSASKGGAVLIHESDSTSILKTDTFVNCIFWNCTQPAVASSYNTPSVVSLTACDYQSGWFGSGINNINADPQFLNSGIDKFNLAPCSPCINTGTFINGIASDIKGTIRPQLGASDIGAYEALTQNSSKPKIYVDIKATGGNDGSSWGNAYNDLQRALNSCCVDTIWVANGKYKPTATNDRNVSFNIRSGMKLFGGFKGNETTLSQRNWRKHISKLSGGINTPLHSDNSSHVVIIKYANSSTQLDGFTIQGGFAGNNKIQHNTQFNSCGAGLYNIGSGSKGGSNPQIKNCTFYFNITGARKPDFTHNTGGAICNDATNLGACRVNIENCKFIRNVSCYGGAIANLTSQYRDFESTISNCIFQNNKAINGGAISTTSSYFGYDSLSTHSKTYYNNCTFVNNIAKSGSVIYSYGSSLVDSIRNSIVWNNSANLFALNYSISKIYYSDVQGGWNGAGSNNINIYPLFTDSANGDFSLQACSPCLNKADTLSASAIDLNYNMRPAYGGFDMGAYEFPDTATINTSVSISVSPSVTVCKNDFVTFTAQAISSFQKNYQWTKNGINVGSDTSIYLINNEQDGDVIVCTLNSNTDCIVESKAVSNSITMSVNPVYIHTDSISIPAGDSIFAGGIWQTQSGVYYDNYLNQFGCDSTLITVLHVLTSFDEISSTSLIQINPNPAIDVITICFTNPSESTANISAYDMQGKIILETIVATAASKPLNIESLVPGVYTLRISIEKKVFFRKLIKQ